MLRGIEEAASMSRQYHPAVPGYISNTQPVSLPPSSQDQKLLAIDNPCHAQLAGSRSSNATARNHAKRASDAGTAISASMKAPRLFPGRSEGPSGAIMLKNDSRISRRW